jgi:hypothetical protein
MRSAFGNPAEVTRELQGQFCPERDIFIGPSKFSIVAKALWPLKTAAHLASIAKRDERTAKRWLAGEYEPPGIIIAAIVFEITKRE